MAINFVSGSVFINRVLGGAARAQNPNRLYNFYFFFLVECNKSTIRLAFLNIFTFMFTLYKRSFRLEGESQMYLC